MKEDGNNVSMLDLPKLAEIFEALRRGKHISVRDGDIFHALKRQHSQYEALFDSLGFKLVHHSRDFFYFFDTANFTELSARMAVFMFILVESLADKGESVEETVLTRRFTYRDLPHLQGERCRTYMREAGVTTPEDLAKIVQTMERFGFARRLDEESFVFEVSIYRFLDLCMEMAADTEQEQAVSDESDTSEEAEQ